MDNPLRLHARSQTRWRVAFSAHPGDYRWAWAKEAHVPLGEHLLRHSTGHAGRRGAAVKAPAGDWRGLLVVVGTSFWDGVPLLERHLAAELTRYGPVLYVDPPVSFLTRFRNRDAARAA